MGDWQIVEQNDASKIHLQKPVYHLKGFTYGTRPNAAQREQFLQTFLQSSSGVSKARTICWDGDIWKADSFTDFIVQLIGQVTSNSSPQQLTLCAFVRQQAVEAFLKSWKDKAYQSSNISYYLVVVPDSVAVEKVYEVAFDSTGSKSAFCWGGESNLARQVKHREDVTFTIVPATRKSKGGKKGGIDVKQLGSYSNVRIMPLTNEVSSIPKAIDEGSTNRHTPRKNNLCLTLHQPWASLMVHGIKRCEGRVWQWPKDIPENQILWIHAASREPDVHEISQVEEQYRQVFQDAKINFPRAYPTSCLLGCVTMVRCVNQKQLEAEFGQHENAAVRSATQESGSPFVFLCKDAMRLVLPISMSGSHKLWKVPKEAASQYELQLKPVRAPCELPI